MKGGCGLARRPERRQAGHAHRNAFLVVRGGRCHGAGSVYVALSCVVNGEEAPPGCLRLHHPNTAMEMMLRKGLSCSRVLERRAGPVRCSL